MSIILLILSTMSLSISFYEKFTDSKKKYLKTQTDKFENSVIMGILFIFIGMLYRIPEMFAIKDLFPEQYNFIMFVSIAFILSYLMNQIAIQKENSLCDNLDDLIISNHLDNFRFFMYVIFVVSFILWVIFISTFNNDWTAIYDNGVTDFIPEIIQYCNIHQIKHYNLWREFLICIVIALFLSYFPFLKEWAEQKHFSNRKNKIISLKKKKENKTESEQRNHEDKIEEKMILDYCDLIVQKYNEIYKYDKLYPNEREIEMIRLLKNLSKCKSSFAKKDIEYLNQNILPDVYDMISKRNLPGEMTDAIIEACKSIIRKENEEDLMQLDATVQGLKTAMAAKGLIKN